MTQHKKIEVRNYPTSNATLCQKLNLKSECEIGQHRNFLIEFYIHDHLGKYVKFL
jgi:hypothetical protein